MTNQFAISVGEWNIESSVGHLPDNYVDYAKHAVLCDNFEIKESDGCICFLAVGRTGTDWPEVIVTQRFDPSSGFNPGALVVASSAVLFVGAGTCLLAYDLQRPCRMWEDYTDVGFWSWRQHGDVVVMAAELELAAWDHRGAKLWSNSVEPPWDYTVLNGEIHLDVMGDRSKFPLSAGPAGE